MGITGLLQALNSITTDVHISELRGQKVAIDIYCWLHKGVYTCAMELCMNTPTTKYIDFCLSRLQLLLDFGVIPVVIFDGGPLPAKRGTEESRRKNREQFRSQGMQHLREGNRTQAHNCFVKAVDVTPQMAYRLIKELRQRNIEYYVSPYEADAQLAFLSLTNYVECIITEDSDLLAFGCKRVIFKMDKFGQGKEIQLCNLGATKNPSFLNFTFQMFRQVCILSGCDYIRESVSGLGIKKACDLLKKFRSIEKVFAYLKSDRKFTVPPNFENTFRKAELTFMHQKVFDNRKNAVVPLTPFPPDIGDCNGLCPNFDFLGADIPQELAVKIAVGQVDPISQLPFDTILNQAELIGEVADSPLKRTPSGSAGVSNNNFLRCSEGASNSPTSSPQASLLPVQKNTISTYFTPVAKAAQKPFMPPRSNTPSDQVTVEEESPEPQMKKLRREDSASAPRILSPQTPPSNKQAQTTVIVSKYWAGTNKRLFTESSPADSSKTARTPEISFSSPLVSRERISLQSRANSLSFTSPVDEFFEKGKKVSLDEVENDPTTNNNNLGIDPSVHNKHLAPPFQPFLRESKSSNSSSSNSADNSQHEYLVAVVEEEEVICSDAEETIQSDEDVICSD
eukprot:TRINITY_DN6219_c0_g1_i1.p1 TRINITY_DN6219_c0_g1~~TRINITY_DN6219_c0_g1_i1.p1  ORF type:complete len:623 (+),score=153.77 TRINITY_DN6219_c0_g1_i1:138-2006(+)